MKKVCIAGALIILIAGCQLELVSPDNPLGIADPNQALAWFEAGKQVGTGTQAVGVAVGNPAIIGVGLLIATVSAILGASVVKKKEK